MSPVIKYILIVLGIAILAILGWLATGFLRTDDQRNPSSPIDDPFGGLGSPTFPSTSKGTISIYTANGSIIQVPDFTKGRTPLESETDTYFDLMHEGPRFGDENYSFGVQYQVSNSFFLVTLLKEPLSASRGEAESFLRSTLMLSDAELCGLNIFAAVTEDINPVYSERGNLGLSFCPGAVPLP